MNLHLVCLTVASMFRYTSAVCQFVVVLLKRIALTPLRIAKWFVVGLLRIVLPILRIAKWVGMLLWGMIIIPFRSVKWGYKVFKCYLLMFIIIWIIQTILVGIYILT